MRALIFLALLGLAAAAHKTPQRIVGGSPTEVENYPYMVSMQYFVWSVSFEHWCGGALINNRAVVSAAHCYIGETASLPSQWRARVGSSKTASGGEVHSVSRLILHPRYDDGNLDNDIAVIRLVSNVLFSDSVAPVSIAGTNYKLADGTVVTVIGWGALSYSGGAPEQLMHVDVNIINWEYCRNQYGEIQESMLCAGIKYVGGKDACIGDSGGPLVHPNPSGIPDVLVGIVSWGWYCAHPDYPGVYADVSQHPDWIVANA